MNIGAGELNTTDMYPLIQEYEQLVSALRTQVDFYKSEHETVRQQVMKVVEENRMLSDRLKKAFNDSILNLDVPNTTNEDIINLQEQLSLLLQEKNMAIDLWQTAQTEIDKLEFQLKESQTDITLMAANESQITEYQNQIKDLEAKLNEEKLKSQTAQNQLDVLCARNTNERDYLLRQNKNAAEKFQALEDEIELLEDKLSTMTICRDELQIALNTCKEQISELQTENIELLGVVDHLKKEKGELIQEISKHQDEAKQLNETLKKLIEESSSQVQKQIAFVAQDYDKKLENVTTAFQRLEDVHKEKCLEIETLTSKNDRLEKELEKYREEHGIEKYEQKNIELQKKLDETLQKMILTEQENVQLQREINELKHDMAAMTRAYERDIQLKQMDMKKLENRIELMHGELKCSNDSFLKVMNDCQLLTEQVKILQEELKQKRKQDEMYEKLKAEYKLMGEEQKICQQFLESQVQMQSDLNHRWKTEVHDITAKFKKCINKLLTENRDLKDHNRYLVDQLQEAREKVDDYVKTVKNIT